MVLFLLYPRFYVLTYFYVPTVVKVSYMYYILVSNETVLNIQFDSCQNNIHFFNKLYKLKYVTFITKIFTVEYKIF